MDLPEILTRPVPTREDQLLPDPRFVQVALTRLAITAASFGLLCVGQTRFPLKIVVMSPLPVGIILGAIQSRRGELGRERGFIGFLSAYHLVGTVGLGLVVWENLRSPWRAVGASLLMVISGRLLFGDEASLSTDDSMRFADRRLRVSKQQIYNRWKRAQVYGGSPLERDLRTACLCNDSNHLLDRLPEEHRSAYLAIVECLVAAAEEVEVTRHHPEWLGTHERAQARFDFWRSEVMNIQKVLKAHCR